MKAAIVAPGESLRFWHGTMCGCKACVPYDLVLAVNRAILACWGECTHWVFLDAYTCQMAVNAGAGYLGPRCVTTLREWDLVCARYRYMKACQFVDRDRFEKLPAELEWRVYTVTTAVAAAVELGARRIDCYGVDQKGTADWDGFTDARQRRNPRRWERERRIWTAVCNHAAAIGIQMRAARWVELNQPTRITATCASS